MSLRISALTSEVEQRQVQYCRKDIEGVPSRQVSRDRGEMVCPKRVGSVKHSWPGNNGYYFKACLLSLNCQL